MIAIALATLLAATIGAPADGATQSAVINASVSKSLVLSSLQNLDFGTITLGPGTWSNATVSLSQTGAISCGGANLVCSGATQAATYNVQGSNRQTVNISAPNVTLVNQSDATKTLTLVTNAPATVVLTSSGHPGNDFSIGGSVTLNSSTTAGTYVGTFNVTVDY
jgi:spore coat protein U-like protein